MMHPPSRLSKANNLLLALIIMVNGYVIAAPFLPALLFAWHNHDGERRQLQRALHPPINKSNSSVLNQSDHIVIPSMLLDQPILEGSVTQAYKVLDRGIWRWPHGSTPDKGGNTVLIGHRFTYTDPRGVFYYLNKVQVGDQIGVFWSHKEYLYDVATITQVPRTDTAIENSSANSELTLFTCTPLWLPKDRLVVVANLERTLP